LDATSPLWLYALSSSPIRLVRGHFTATFAERSGPNHSPTSEDFFPNPHTPIKGLFGYP